MTAKRTFLTAILSSTILFSFAQEKAVVSGKVTDAATNLPIPYVNVFFNNTTLGAATDSLGRYRIAGVPTELKELIASAIGYATLKVSLDLQSRKNLTVDFNMRQEDKVLSPVVIRAKRDINGADWYHRFNQFKKIFLGQHSNAASIEILNPYIVYFLEGEDKDTWTAHADQPLQIENRALGYKLFVTIDEFNASQSAFKMLITTRFDTLASTNFRENERWQFNRVKTYKGSPRHLFKSIIDGRYQEEGFRIYKGDLTVDVNTKQMVLTPGEVPVAASAIYPDATKGSTKILSKGLYQINYVNTFVPKKERALLDYPFAVSWINIRDPLLTVAPNGEPNETANYTRMGYMNTLRVADMLPYDFDPVKEESKIVLSQQMAQLSIRGTVTDENNNPLSEVEVFINNGLTHTTTNRWGQFELSNLNPGRYPIGFAYGPKQEELRTVDLRNGTDAEITVQLKKRNSQFIIPQQDQDWVISKDLFISKLFKLANLPGQPEVTNPNILRFEKSKKRIDVKFNAPLLVESKTLGYQWEYFIDQAVLVKKRGTHKLSISGLVKMDTLRHKSRREFYKWQANRFDEYLGSWNNFTKALIEGRVEDEGFTMYQLKNPSQTRRVRFKKLTNNELSVLNPDSLLIVHKEGFNLKVLRGLEIHYQDKKGDQKFYKGYSKQVMRLTSDSSQVPISITGVMATKDVVIMGINNESLKKVPVDYLPSTEKITNPDVLVLVKETHLQAIKDLREKTYIQTDKSYYYPGDTIWMKAYLKYFNDSYKDSLSKVLYVDLVDPQNKVMANRLLKIDEGQATGDFVLKGNLTAGDYYLRAYTEWMRNFGEFFVRPLPIISRDNFIVSQPADTTSLTQNINLTIDQATDLRTREAVNLDLRIAKNGNPAPSTFSVSITDQSAVADLNGIPTIASLDQPYKADGSHMIRITHAIEQGIRFTGQVLNGKEKETYIVTALLPKKPALITKITGDKFRLTLDFNDTLTAVIQCMNRGDLFLHSHLLEKDSVGFFTPPAPLSYQLHTNTSYTRSSMYFGKDVRILDNVTISAKRILPPEANNSNSVLLQARYGPADRVTIIEGKDIIPIRKQDLRAVINTLAPNYAGTELPTITTGMPGAMSSSGTPLFTDSTISMFNKAYIFYVDGQLVLNLQDFIGMSTSQISRIETYYFRTAKQPNVLAFYTEATVPLYFQNFDKFLLRGYNVPLTFKTPETKGTVRDYRSTLYWNPLIKTDENGNATISFRTSDVDGTYKITIEGMTATGEIFRVVKLLTIAKQN